MDKNQTDWRSIGTHFIRVADDVLFVRIHGVVELGDLRELVRVGAELTVRYGYYLSVADATYGQTMTPEARRYNAEWLRDHPEAPGSSIVYGANVATRTIITMINRATSILARKPVAAHFVKDEAAALERAQQERQRLRALVGRPAPPR